MGQVEVYQWLAKQRARGDDSFYSPAEITEALKKEGLSDGQLRGIPRDCLQLEGSKFLEAEVRKDWRDWRRCFRLKKEYLVKKV